MNKEISMGSKIHHADIKEWAANYDGPLFDGILCDPPYELGFMGKSWDSTGIAFDVDLWKDLLRICKPGAHLLAFSGSRTYHRMAVAIEDAGFEIRDMIEWVYGSGFPKSLNIGKAVDKIQGNEREYLGKNPNSRLVKRDKNSAFERPVDTNPAADMKHLTKGTSEWEGYGTALKPAHEPCVLARKPIEGTVANNVLKHGTGGLAIDNCRVSHSEPQKTTVRKARSAGWNMENTGFDSTKNDTASANPTGRFPANLIHDGSDEVEAVFPQTKSQAGVKNLPTSNIYGGNSLLSSKTVGTGEITGYSDSGSASRFFYTAKASKSERNAGLEDFEDRRAGAMEFRNRESEKGQFEGEPQYAKNHHPTVKPLSLTKYLATLIKPPTGGRLLVPFSGSGSEMIGALQAGWEYVEGVEITEEYIPIAEARIKYWVEQESKQVVLV